MRILVTGAAGFIGSHLCEALLKEHTYEVIGVDTFIGPTPPEHKMRNIQTLMKHSRFTFKKMNLLDESLPDLLEGVEAIYHLAAIPGVRSSWGAEFSPYVYHNILMTQRLLEAAKDKAIHRFIYISTSSIYGEKTGMVTERAFPKPLSPYGITKLSGEHLCRVYEKSYDIPLVILRYFTVYGPRQRPDMAFHRFIKQLITNQPITVFGDGNQSRDFTYIDDCVTATKAALTAEDALGETINIGGKERASVLEIIERLERITGKNANISFSKKVKGEPTHTWADIRKAEKILNYSPVIPLAEGLVREYHFLQGYYGEDMQ
ncbi:NAD-dependent epimerase/dehydratase family protein [Sutcliffiella rhizosphaerae]|uniref:dTDP-glucose 4,6-dehydratase n=1 Tax=Sutcliffiella rhizosphaerae TaxID=2880967 RepID=A0ABN8A5A7_9BACI|nr:NAD-dependent epimerase/dehydratase family protein [Sutcliffiella rhizosphaerae]CAG9620281.1 dTDP-glucose 4,6-dehydratase [Sutcliffiella rhizosphaerae]